MSDLIRKQEAIYALADAGVINYCATGDGNGMIQAINVIKALPTADAIPIWWIKAWWYRYRFDNGNIDNMLEAWETWRKEHESIR